MQVTCRASCDGNAVLGLETPLTKKEVANGINWKTYELSDIQEDSTPLCFSNCNGIQSTASVTLIVYSLPKRVELAPLPPWQPVGEDLTLRCEVEGGAPRTNLSVLLLRGEEELSRQLAEGETAEFTLLASRGDHGANFSCRTELDLRPKNRGLFQNSSVPRQLRTFVLPKTHPHLVSPRIMEVGTQQHVNCTLDGLFPASEAQVHLVLEDHRLETTVEYNKDSLLATACIKANTEEEGTQQLTCTVTLGNQSQWTLENVTIYSFPAPILTLSPPNVSEGTVVSVECKACAGAVVTLQGAPAGPPGPSAQFLLNATSNDDGRIFLCSAALEVAGTVLRKNTTQELRVLYNSNQVVTIILVAAAVTLISVCTAAYLYNRQRKIREYKLQKAREANAMKLNTPP